MVVIAEAGSLARSSGTKIVVANQSSISARTASIISAFPPGKKL